MSMMETGILGKVNFNKDVYNDPKPQQMQQQQKVPDVRQSFIIGQEM
jgi:hypothetical protein